MELNTMKRIIQRHESMQSEFILHASIAERYYLNDADILYKEKPKSEDDQPLRNADNRIPRNFHGLLVNQKAAYAFTTPPTFDVGNQGQNKLIADTLGDRYIKNCMDLCINAANTGVGWVHYWRNEEGAFRWAVVDSKQVYPIFSEDLDEKLLAVLRSYKMLDENDGEAYIVYEYWTDRECQAFRRRTTDTVNEGLSIYDMFSNPMTGEPYSEYVHGLGDVPFIPFFNNNTHTNDLRNIKRLIDVYDKVYSGFINDLDDIQELIFVLSGYGGTDLNGFMSDLKKYKVIKLDETEGSPGVSTISIEIPIEARNSVLEATRKAIFEQGMGFDPRPENFGNQSGVALKFMYALLEMKTGFMQAEFTLGFNKLVRAILTFHGQTTGNIQQRWKRTAIQNDQEIASICRESVGVISKRTIVANHPFVIDVNEELKQMEKEDEQTEEENNQYANAFPKKEEVNDEADEGEEQ